MLTPHLSLHNIQLLHHRLILRQILSIPQNSPNSTSKSQTYPTKSNQIQGHFSHSNPLLLPSRTLPLHRLSTLLFSRPFSLILELSHLLLKHSYKSHNQTQTHFEICKNKIKRPTSSFHEILYTAPSIFVSF